MGLFLKGCPCIGFLVVVWGVWRAINVAADQWVRGRQGPGPRLPNDYSGFGARVEGGCMSQGERKISQWTHKNASRVKMGLKKKRRKVCWGNEHLSIDHKRASPADLPSSCSQIRKPYWILLTPRKSYHFFFRQKKGSIKVQLHFLDGI